MVFQALCGKIAWVTCKVYYLVKLLNSYNADFPAKLFELSFNLSNQITIHLFPAFVSIYTMFYLSICKWVRIALKGNDITNCIFSGFHKFSHLHFKFKEGFCILFFILGRFLGHLCNVLL